MDSGLESIGSGRDGVVGRILAALAERAAAPSGQARAMIGDYYTAPEFLALERDALFPREWVCLCHEGELPGPGDYLATELCGEPLLLVRGAAGDLKVLSNVCRHRGNLVAEGRGTAKFLSCAYHGWTYATDDGALVGAPLMKGQPGYDPACLGLPAFRSELWNGFLFVNLDGAAAPLGPRLAGLDALVANYRMTERHHLFSREDRWATNWKCLAENFLEGYHLSVTHRTTLHPITPTRLCEKIPGSAAFTGYRSHYDPAWPERGPFPPSLSEAERRHSLLLCVFPSFVLSVAPHFTLYMCLRPTAVGEVALRWGLVGVPDDPEAPVVRDYLALCEAFNAEDRAKLETLFRGLGSRAYRPGPLAADDYEGTVHDCYRYMASRLASPAG